MKKLRVTDNDRDEISVMYGDKQVRGWSYADEGERRVKILCAREFVEGFYHDLATNRELVEVLEIADAHLVAAVNEYGGIDECDIGLRVDLEKIRSALSRARGEGISK